MAEEAVGVVADFPCKLFHCLILSVVLIPLCLETHRVILLSAFSKVKRGSGPAKSSGNTGNPYNKVQDAEGQVISFLEARGKDPIL